MKKRRKVKKKEKKFEELERKVREQISLNGNYVVIVRTKRNRRKTFIDIRGLEKNETKELIARVLSRRLCVFNSLKNGEILLSGFKPTELQQTLVQLGFDYSLIKIV